MAEVSVILVVEDGEVLQQNSNDDVEENERDEYIVGEEPDDGSCLVATVTVQLRAVRLTNLVEGGREGGGGGGGGGGRGEGGGGGRGGGGGGGGRGGEGGGGGGRGGGGGGRGEGEGGGGRGEGGGGERGGGGGGGRGEGGRGGGGRGGGGGEGRGKEDCTHTLSSHGGRGRHTPWHLAGDGASPLRS